MIIDYPHNRPLAQYPRNIVRAAEEYMRSTGVADTMMILPEFEFYLFDSVTWQVEPNAIGMTLDAQQAHWNSAVNGQRQRGAQTGALPYCQAAGLYLRLPQRDVHADRSRGIPVKYHHPEVGGAGQFEIDPMLGEMSKMADATMTIKYIIHNVAEKYGLSATLMPKPVCGEAGNGYAWCICCWLKDGLPVFSDDAGYAHLSREAHYFMGGLLKHIRRCVPSPIPAPTRSSAWSLVLKHPSRWATPPATAARSSGSRPTPKHRPCAALNCAILMPPATPISAMRPC